jgi:hypothetical protein
MKLRPDQTRIDADESEQAVSKQDYLANLRASRQELLAALSTADEASLASVPICGIWTGQQVLSHLAAAELAALEVARQVGRGASPRWAWEGVDGDQWNQDTVDERQGLKVDQLLSELANTHAALVAELESWPTDGGPFGANTWDEDKSEIGWVASHEREHGEAIGSLRRTLPDAR